MEYNAKQMQIINVAEKLFAEKGFAATSVRDIANEADVNVSMISYYFGSKEKLAEALFVYRMEESQIRLENILYNDDLTALQKVYIMIDSVIERLFENQSFHKIMMREQLSSERTAFISDHIYNMKQKNSLLMQSLIKEGQRVEGFNKNLDFTLMTITLYGTINQALATQDFYKKLNSLEDMDPDEFKTLMKRRLSLHLKNLFKSTVTNEQNN